MDKDILYKIMESVLETEFGIESLKSVTGHIMASFKAREEEENEQLFHCYNLVLSSMEKGIRDCINMIDEYIVTDKE